MEIIGSSPRQLQHFSLEVLSGILKPEWIREAAQAATQPTRRDRKLPTPFVIWLLVSMGLYRSLAIQNVLDRIGNLLGLTPLWKSVPSSAAVVEARNRLGFRAMRVLLERFQSWLLETYREAMSWRGMLLLILDGTTLKTSDSPENRRRFGLASVSRGGRSAFPMVRALLLTSAKLLFILGAWFYPYRRNEVAMAKRILDVIPRGALLLVDRQYLAWEFLWGHLERGGQFLVRIPKNVRRRRLERLATGDWLVEIRTRREARRRTPELPRTLVVRELTARINGKWFCYLSSLLDSKRFSAGDLVGLYAKRWEVETGIDEVKTHQCGRTTVNRPVLLRSQSSRRVFQEAYGLLIAYNLVRTLMGEASKGAGRDPLHVSFTDSMELIRQAAAVMALARTEELPKLYSDLLSRIARHTLPRRQRSNPREVCVKMSNYPKKWKRA
jgi:hypothetical protein